MSNPIKRPWKSVEKVMPTRNPLPVTGPWHHKSSAKLVAAMVTSLVTLSAAQAPELAVSIGYFFMDACIPLMHLIARS